MVDVISHLNRPKHACLNRSWKDQLKIPGEPFNAFHDDTILFAAQPIAVVVAETFEAARFAASLVEVAYEAEPHNIDFEKSLEEISTPIPAGDVTRSIRPRTTATPRTRSPRRLGAKNVRVVNAFIGGGFGGALRPQWQLQVATMAAMHLQRFVRVVMTRL